MLAEYSVHYRNHHWIIQKIFVIALKNLFGIKLSCTFDSIHAKRFHELCTKLLRLRKRLRCKELILGFIKFYNSAKYCCAFYNLAVIFTDKLIKDRSATCRLACNLDIVRISAKCRNIPMYPVKPRLLIKKTEITECIG